MNIAIELAEKLLKINAIKLSPKEPYTWASGMRSPIYCDNRLSLSHPEVRIFIKKAFALECNKLTAKPDIIIGVATAGIAHGALLADELGIPFAYVRSKAKAHGRQNQIEGEVKAGQKALVIEDLISTGGSSLQAVEVLREAKIEVIAVGAIFDYGFDISKENFNIKNCDYFSLSNYVTLLEKAVESDYINQEQKNILKDWNQDPKTWFDKNFNS
jgi:orotate phosphoribosyltransferase